MSNMMNRLRVIKAALGSPQMIRLNPSLIWFFSRYMMKFQGTVSDKNVLLHSHLPPLNSKAYSRFISEHLLARTEGPSHAQIGITNDCPQNCEYCYNRNRTGQVMDTETIIGLIRELQDMGVVWLGLTGGEPLLNKDIVKITKTASERCAVKLFTTGCTLTKNMAYDLKDAGLFSVCISLDHYLAEEHDKSRRYKGAYQQALKAIDTFKKAGIHVGVSAVFSRDMIRNGKVNTFMDFLIERGVDEAWLSEVKPSIEQYLSDEHVIDENDRLALVDIQDRLNRKKGITVNYLGHFEGKEHFGCNAGRKMIYIDAFGEVSPCVFTPMTFGNVSEKPVMEIFNEMKPLFKPSHEGCFINTNYRLLKKYSEGRLMLDKESSVRMMSEASFGPLSKFGQIFYGSR